MNRGPFDEHGWHRSKFQSRLPWARRYVLKAFLSFGLSLHGITAYGYDITFTKRWYCSSSYWDISACWRPQGVPGSSDVVAVHDDIGSAQVTARIDNVTGTVDISTLSVDSSSASEVRVLQSGGEVFTRTTRIGDHGNGRYEQLDGTHTVGSRLYLGYGSSAVGTYILDGGTVKTFYSDVGYRGAGMFRQTGGTHESEFGVALGVNVGSLGLYELSGGELRNGLGIFVGGEGPGRFIQDGGRHETPNMYIGGLRGLYELNEGTLSALRAYIGDGGVGGFAQRGGAFDAASMWIGRSSGSVGEFYLSGGTLTVRNSEVLGSEGWASFTQNGGTHSVGETLVIGSGRGTTATYSLDAGTLTVGDGTSPRPGRANPGVLVVGSFGNGTFVQRGGDVTIRTDGELRSVTGYLEIGRNAGATGEYILYDGTLQVDKVAMVGRRGTGYFGQFGGIHKLDGLNVSYDAGSEGRYELQGGTLSVGKNESIGYYGTSGQFLQKGGLHQVGGDLYLARAVGSEGFFDLSGGSLTIVRDLYVGKNGNGDFDQNGGNLSVGGDLYVGSDRYGSGSGRFTQSAGSLTVAGTEFISTRGFVQEGGSNSAREIYLNADYSLNGGNVGAQYIRIGEAGSGRLVQNGGDVAAYSLTVGSRGDGTYDLSNGTLTANVAVIGGRGDGVFNQTGGLVDILGTYIEPYGLQIGSPGAGSGTYNLSSGGLDVEKGVDLYGNLNIGVGGRMKVNGALKIRDGAALSMNGGTMDAEAVYNDGRAEISGVLNLDRSISTSAGRTVRFTGATQINGNLGNGRGSLVEVTNGSTVVVNGDAIHNGEMRMEPDSTIVFEGRVQGEGDYRGAGTIRFNGFVMPGNSIVRLGDNIALIEIEGDMVLGPSSVASMEVEGYRRGLGYDAFDVGGELTLSGTLEVNLMETTWGPFSPALGASFDLFRADTISGSFDTLLLPALGDGLRWDFFVLEDASGTLDIARLQVSAVPAPAAAWLFGSGLVGLVAVARRRDRRT